MSSCSFPLVRRRPILIWLVALVLAVRPGEARAQTSGGGGLDNFEREILFVVARARPFVVNIEAVVDPDSGVNVGRSGVRRLPPRRIGSGIFVSTEGGIVTTASIVDGASSITIRSPDGSPHEAKVIGIDRRTNIAVLSCAGTTLPAARLGDSSLAPPGARVVVVGSYPVAEPLCSFGTIVMDRGLVWGFSEVEMMQISAPVKGVNSGSAVVNSEGRVVGMVCGVYDESRSSGRLESRGGLSGYIFRDRVAASPHQDAFFAVPIERVLDIAAELKERGRVDRGFLGIIVQRDESTDQGKGVLVREILRDGPADAAGIRVGDVILQYAGRDLSIGDDLTFMVTATRPGSRVGVQVRTADEPPRHLDVVIGRAPNIYAWLPRELDPTLYPEKMWPEITPPEGMPANGGKAEAPKINRQKKP